MCTSNYGKYWVDNNRTYHFQCFCYDHWNAHVHSCFSLLNSFFYVWFLKVRLLSQRIYKCLGFLYLLLCYFSSNIQSICIVLDKAPHTFKECSYTCFIWVQMPGSSVEKGRIWYKFYCKNSKPVGFEQMPLIDFTPGGPLAIHVLSQLSETSGFKLTV